MKALPDACVWGGALRKLKEEGHDVIWAGHWAEDPGDEEILGRAHRDRRVLVTLDKDFGELAIVKGVPHSGILRLVGFRAEQQGRACTEVLARHAQDLLAGAVITVSPSRLRIRPPEGKGSRHS